MDRSRFPTRICDRARHAAAALATALLLGGCGSGDDGTLDVALIGAPAEVFADDLRLSPVAQHVRAASQSGLVTFDAQGEVVPALAETWLPTEDGMSYVFRLRDIPWPDGSVMTAQSARTALLAAMDRLEGTSLAQDLHLSPKCGRWPGE